MAHCHFSYGRPKRLWRMVYQTQLGAINALFRRNDGIDLGGYSVGDFKRFYAGLLAVCAVHENACDLRVSVYNVNAKKCIAPSDSVETIEQGKLKAATHAETYLRQVANLELPPLHWKESRAA